MRHITATLVALFVAGALRADEKPFPPGWLPVKRLDDKVTWSDFRKIDDQIHIYIPPNAKTIRGVFACFVFHSQDPRELADLWNFALVTVPWPFEYDLGVNDKRNGRYKLGHPMQDMGLLLRYLEAAATETGHRELSSAPIVGWLGQNGPKLCSDLYERAPERVLAWSDGFPGRLDRVPELTAKIPFAYAWEFTKKDEKERAVERAKATDLKDRPTPPPDLKCRANTYDFPHGIYSKFSFFAIFLDRCIAARLPTNPPEPGKPVKLKPWNKKDGWAGDYNAVGAWNPVAPYKDAKGMVNPVWFPDAYLAWTWRAYHTHKPNLKLTSPVIEYRKKDGKWGGPECGLGYGGSVKPGTPLMFAAAGKGEYTKVEFHDGDKVVATAEKYPWRVENIKLERGLHALFAVGIKPDGTRSASRAAFLVVK